MSIVLLFSNLIISFKILNYENKSKTLRFNKLSSFQDILRFRHFSFKSTRADDINFLILNKKIFSYILNCSNLF